VLLRHPVDEPDQAAEVARETGLHPRPKRQDCIGLRIPSAEARQRPLPKTAQQLDRIGDLARRQTHPPGRLRLPGQRPQRAHRIGQHDGRQVVRLQEVEHQPRGSRLQIKRRGQHVGVAMNQVQPAVPPRIAERLVARVDDRAVVLHPLIKIVLDVIRPLADLKIDRRGTGIDERVG
jgi:hypothetical protein